MYLLFAGDQYYPAGGWNDFIDEFPTEAEALARAANTECNWWHIVHDGVIVNSGHRK